MPARVRDEVSSRYLAMWRDPRHQTHQMSAGLRTSSLRHYALTRTAGFCRKKLSGEVSVNRRRCRHAPLIQQVIAAGRRNKTPSRPWRRRRYRQMRRITHHHSVIGAQHNSLRYSDLATKTYVAQRHAVPGEDSARAGVVKPFFCGETHRSGAHQRGVCLK